MNLTSKKCVPCQETVLPFNKKEIKRYIGKVDCWKAINEPFGKVPKQKLSHKPHHIEKEFKFKNFKEALSFTNKIGKLAEKEGHHPDIYLAWGNVKVIIYTHKINGLHENDFILASKIDKIKKMQNNNN